jgi:HK97 family phage major capsid protein
MGTYEQKLMSTGAGWGPETISIPRWIEFAHRPIQVTELFPVGNTSDYAVMYQEETTSTNAATGVGESGTYPESTIIFTKRTVLVKKVATYIGVTDEQLADVNQVASLLDNRLRFFVNQEFDRQLMVGDGLGDNMQGLINTPGLQTQARGGDPIVDAVYKGVVKCRVTGRSQPNAIVLHPTNMQDVRLMKDANGNYIWGAPSDAGVLRMWGIPIVEADLLTLGTGVVGDFANMSQIWMRMGVEVLTGYINDQFIKGQQAIRATMRACLTVYRPTGFCSVTGL